MEKDVRELKYIKEAERLIKRKKKLTDSKALPKECPFDFACGYCENNDKKTGKCKLGYREW